MCACTVDNPLAKARDYLSVQANKSYSISHLLRKGIDVIDPNTKYNHNLSGQNKCL